MSLTYWPSDFESSSPPPRIIGTEMEYTVGRRTALKINSHDMLRHVLNASGIRHMFNYTTNGSRIYEDVGLLEYATPECSGPWQATAADHAGMRVIQSVVKWHDENIDDSYKLPAIRVNGSYNPDEEKTATAGYHENFLTIDFDKSRRTAMVGKFLSSFLASRIVWNGNGLLEDQFRLSQKAPGIGAEIARSRVQPTEHGNKTMGAIVDSAGSKNKIAKNWMLFESRLSDSHMSRRGTLLGLGSTSLALRLLEQGKINARNVSDYLLDNPLRDLRRINSPDNMHLPLTLVSGKTVTAAELQCKIFEKVLDMSDEVELPADEMLCVEDILETLDLLKKSSSDDIKPIATRVEWAAKLYAIQKMAGEDFVGDNYRQAIALDRKWHSLGEGNGELFWQRVDPYHRNLEKEVVDLQDNPPFTRAFARAGLIERDDCHDVKWDNVKLRIGHRISRQIFLRDPYNPEPQSATNIL